MRIPLSYCVGTGAPKLPQGGPGLQHNEEISLDEDTGVSPWEAWNALRTKCEFNSKVQVALEITADLPSSEELKRWLGEPVRVYGIRIEGLTCFMYTLVLSYTLD